MKMHERIKPIRTESDHKEALALIDELIDAEPGSDEYRVLDVVSELVHAYEEKNVYMPLPSPLAALRFRMDQLGLSQRDLQPYIGSSGKVSEVLSGKQPLTLKMMRALHKHLRIPAEVLLEDPNKLFEDSDLASYADQFPLAEMCKLGWFSKFGDQIEGREEEAVSWLIGRAGLTPRQIAVCCRKNDNARQNSKMDIAGFQAWSLHVLAAAAEQEVTAAFDRASINEGFLRSVAALSTISNGPVYVSEFLAQKGIRFVFAPHLKKTYLDGAAMLMADGSPVVALTLRYDRIDNFWHTLIHELIHVRYDLMNPGEIISDDLSLPSAESAIEKRADTLAAEALVPESSLPPLETMAAMDAEGLMRLAQLVNVHPAIVAGRIRHKTNNWRKFARVVNAEGVRQLF